jgi:glycerophosphoryl diester phosphodiesterase
MKQGDSIMHKMNRRELCKLLATASAGASLLKAKTAQAQAPPPYVYPRWDINALQQQLVSPSPNLVLIAAHRGLWRDTPENSETGFRISFAKWEMIETDLLKTSDYVAQNELLITHDPEISRTLNGAGWHYNITMEQFRTLRLLDRFGAIYNGGNWYPGDKSGTPMNDASRYHI